MSLQLSRLVSGIATCVVGLQCKGRNYFWIMQYINHNIFEDFFLISIWMHCKAVFNMQINLFKNGYFGYNLSSALDYSLFLLYFFLSENSFLTSYSNLYSLYLLFIDLR